MKNKSFDKIVDERCSCSHFNDKKPNWRDIVDEIDAGRKGPLAGNIPSVKFILVDDEKKIDKLAESCQQSFISKAHFVVVVCNDLVDVVRSYDERGKRYARQQAGSSIENLLLKLTELGLGACWIGAFVDDQVKNILKIPENVNVEAVIPIGYPMRKQKQKRKPSLDRVLYFNEYKGKVMKPKKKVEAA